MVDLKNLVEPPTRGDPMQPLLWTTRSLRNLVNELAKKGHTVCPTVVGDLLRGMGYSLQANSKTREGDKHIDRDAQFQYINTQAKGFLDESIRGALRGGLAKHAIADGSKPAKWRFCAIIPQNWLGPRSWIPVLAAKWLGRNDGRKR